MTDIKISDNNTILSTWAVQIHSNTAPNVNQCKHLSDVLAQNAQPYSNLQ